MGAGNSKAERERRDTTRIVSPPKKDASIRIPSALISITPPETVTRLVTIPVVVDGFGTEVEVPVDRNNFFALKEIYQKLGPGRFQTLRYGKEKVNLETHLKYYSKHDRLMIHKLEIVETDRKEDEPVVIAMPDLFAPPVGAVRVIEPVAAVTPPPPASTIKVVCQLATTTDRVILDLPRRNYWTLSLLLKAIINNKEAMRSMFGFTPAEFESAQGKEFLERMINNRTAESPLALYLVGDKSSENPGYLGPDDEVVAPLPSNIFKDVDPTDPVLYFELALRRCYFVVKIQPQKSLLGDIHANFKAQLQRTLEDEKRANGGVSLGEDYVFAVENELEKIMKPKIAYLAKCTDGVGETKMNEDETLDDIFGLHETEPKKHMLSISQLIGMLSKAPNREEFKHLWPLLGPMDSVVRVRCFDGTESICSDLFQSHNKVLLFQVTAAGDYGVTMKKDLDDGFIHYLSRRGKPHPQIGGGPTREQLAKRLWLGNF